ncbi:Putative neutral zinc metallopeptidase [Candidatus Xiphinematobacter sp. Idaho Grape]|uniref:zinc metallopeptidase n=1 Tax=Candidatus Xiphinematobacter sp. Idaho Grape TaxID=1704307 RepID=UPI000705A074|nr:zinc metallopeptidase [Candidatus Xiphinematobacter sp. Idaho Grape]ALJ56471.1 Putative neutral zinc metallopeptidase [Candidatus Xiphinematobacter sp. Idaho Grape]
MKVDSFFLYAVLIGIPFLLGIYAQVRVSGTFSRWKGVPVGIGLTGAEVAREILTAAGIHDVEVLPIEDMLGDHYDPSSKRLCLSPDVYRGASVAAAGIAAHESGHAIQHARAYAPLHLRMAIVPVTQVASQLLPFVILGGFFFHFTGLITVGIICYLVLTLFQLITLPVEFDASARAKIILQQMGIIGGREETRGISDVLDSAALTYVAAFIASLGNLIYLFLSRPSSRD